MANRRQAQTYANPDVIYQSPRGLQGRHVIAGDSGELRFIDAAVAAGSAGASVAWVATRPPGQDLAWAGFLGVLGVFTFVEGKGELSAFGAGLLGGNTGYLIARLLGR